MAKTKTIAILYHKIRPSEEDAYFSKQHVIADGDTANTVKYLEHLFEDNGFRVKIIGVTPANLTGLSKLRADYIYNLVDSKAMEMKIAGILDRLRVPHSGSPLTAIRISNNKIRTKKLFEKYGISTPAYRIIPPTMRITKRLVPGQFPVIVKPAFEHCSVGITERSIAVNYEQFRKIVKRQRKEYAQTLLAEQFIVGREFHVTVLETYDKTTALPIAEITFRRRANNKWNIYGFDEKWDNTLPAYTSAKIVCPPKRLSTNTAAFIRRDAVRAFYLFGLKDYARFDLRFDPRKRSWYFLEANANAGIAAADPNDPMNMSIKAAGMTLADFILSYVDNGLVRSKHKKRY